MSDVVVTETQPNKLMLSWSPGHDGFSPLTKCQIRVKICPEPCCPLRFPGKRNPENARPFFQVKEVSQRKGEVTVTRLINVTTPPFHSEVPGLQALTWYNMSVSCSNEVGSSPITTWVQSSTTEGGMWALRKLFNNIQVKHVCCTVCCETAADLFLGSIVLLILTRCAYFVFGKPKKIILVIHKRPPLYYGLATH